MIKKKMATQILPQSQKVFAQKRLVRVQLRQVSLRKGKKYAQPQLAARMPLVELKLKQKSDLVCEAKKMGFQPGKIGTLSYFNLNKLAKLYTSKTARRTLLNVERVNSSRIQFSGDSKRKCFILCIAIEEGFCICVNLL